MANRRITRAKLRDKRRTPNWITSRLATQHVLDGIDLRIESCPQFWKLSFAIIASTRSRLTRNGLGRTIGVHASPSPVSIFRFIRLPTEGAGSGDSTGHSTDAPSEERGCGQTTESGCMRSKRLSLGEDGKAYGRKARTSNRTRENLPSGIIGDHGKRSHGGNEHLSMANYKNWRSPAVLIP